MLLSSLIKHPHWPGVQYISKKLHEAGHLAYLAGGCVRDALLGVSPHDFDIATNASPDEVEKIFAQALPVGKQFGVMIVPFKGFHIEVASFRSDQAYVDGRRPTGVVLSDPRKDAERRDFTVNAMFLDLAKAELIDFVGGQEDLKKRVLRTVGEARERFTEDKLRILRCVRLAAQLDFAIERETEAAVVAMAKEVKVVSRERVASEIEKMLLSPKRVKGLELLRHTGLLTEVLPVLQVQGGLAWAAIKFSLQAAKSEKRLAVLLALLFAPQARSGLASRQQIGKFLREAKFSHAVIGDMEEIFVRDQKLRQELPVSSNSTEVSARTLKLFDGPVGLMFLDFWYLEWRTGEANSSDPTARQNEYELMMKTLGRYLELADLNGKLPSPVVSGHDLMNWGVPQSAQMGEWLAQIYDLQLEGQISSKAEAQSWVEKKSVR